jgi:hypothetical protein
MTENSAVFFFVSTVLNFASTVLNFASTVFFFVSTVLNFASTVFFFVSTVLNHRQGGVRSYVTIAPVGAQYLYEIMLNSYKEHAYMVISS